MKYPARLLFTIGTLFSNDDSLGLYIVFAQPVKAFPKVQPVQRYDPVNFSPEELLQKKTV